MNPPNPPAFPNTLQTRHKEGGMTLRDYFAAAVAPGIIVSEFLPFLMDYKGENEALEGSTWPKCAAYAYRMADAMLAERAKADTNPANGV